MLNKVKHRLQLFVGKPDETILKTKDMKDSINQKVSSEEIIIKISWLQENISILHEKLDQLNRKSDLNLLRKETKL